MSANPIIITFKTIPEILYKRTISLTNTIAEKLHDFGNVVRGNVFENTTDMIQMSKKNFEFIQKLRKNAPEKYSHFVAIAHLVKDKTLEEQAIQISRLI